MDEMCPNCVTPWKCNGPHNPDWQSGMEAKAMSSGDIEAMKRIHNAKVLEGRSLLVRLEELGASVNDLRARIKKADPDEYDEIRLLFDGTFIDGMKYD